MVEDELPIHWDASFRYAEIVSGGNATSVALILKFQGRKNKTDQNSLVDTDGFRCYYSKHG